MEEVAKITQIDEKGRKGSFVSIHTFTSEKISRAKTESASGVGHAFLSPVRQGIYHQSD